MSQRLPTPAVAKIMEKFCNEKWKLPSCPAAISHGPQVALYYKNWASRSEKLRAPGLVLVWLLELYTQLNHSWFRSWLSPEAYIHFVVHATQTFRSNTTPFSEQHVCECVMYFVKVSLCHLPMSCSIFNECTIQWMQALSPEWRCVHSPYWRTVCSLNVLYRWSWETTPGPWMPHHDFE